MNFSNLCVIYPNNEFSKLEVLNIDMETIYRKERKTNELKYRQDLNYVCLVCQKDINEKIELKKIR